MISARKTHRWISWFAGIPLFIILLSGVLLQYKGQIPGMQSEAIFSSDLEIAFKKNWSIESLFEIAKTHHPEHVKVLGDLRVVDIRPHRGTARIRTADYHEIQIDLSNGTVLKMAPRFASWVIALHEGALLGNVFRFGFWAPIGVLSLFLSLSGFLILIRKRRISHE